MDDEEPDNNVQMRQSQHGNNYHESFERSLSREDILMAEEEYSYMEDGESMGDSMFSGANNESGIMSGQEAVPDIMLLNVFCARAKPAKDSEESRMQAEKSWEPVREWLATHTAEEVQAAAEQRGESGLTALHFACRHDPPFDVIDVLLSIAVETAQWPDSFGWLPVSMNQ